MEPNFLSVDASMEGHGRVKNCIILFDYLNCRPGKVIKNLKEGLGKGKGRGRGKRAKGTSKVIPNQNLGLAQFSELDLSSQGMKKDPWLQGWWSSSSRPPHFHFGPRWPWVAGPCCHSHRGPSDNWCRGCFCQYETSQSSPCSDGLQAVAHPVGLPSSHMQND